MYINWKNKRKENLKEKNILFWFYFVHLTNERKRVDQLEGKHIYLLTFYLADQNYKASQIKDF